jgi:hypothetical protein
MFKTNLFKIITVLTAVLVLPFLGYSITTYNKTLQFSGNQSAWASVLMSDGGYVATGFTCDYQSTDTNLFVIRFDRRGEKIWSKSFGGAKLDFGFFIIKTSDGNLVVAGSTQSLGNGSDDFYLLKLDTSGNFKWQQTFGTAGSDIARSLCETVDGGLCLAGYTTLSSTNAVGYLVKTNADGAKQWAYSYGGPGDNHFYGIRQLADGGFIMTGGTTNPNISHGGMDVYLVKTDPSGNMKWQKAIGGPYFDEGKYIILDPKGNYVIAGQTALRSNSGVDDDDAYLLYTDTSGTKKWDQPYGGTFKDLARSVENTADGGFVIGAITRSYNHTKPQMWLIKTNNVGTPVFNTTYGTETGHQHCYQAKQTPDGGYLLVGHSDSYSANFTLNIFEVRTDALGAIVGVNDINLLSGIKVFPNPATTQITIDLKSEKTADYSFRIVNILGEEMYKETEKVNAGIGSKTIAIASSAFKPGTYFLEIQSEGYRRNEKIVIH